MTTQRAIAADKRACEELVAKVERGLSHPQDGSYWRGRAHDKIAALDEDGAAFGLVPHEEATRKRLCQLLGLIPEHDLPPFEREELTDDNDRR